MKIAYSYVRFSTAAQGKEGRDSTRRQGNSAKEWCERNPEYTLSKQKFLDAGKSGFKGEHIDKDGDLSRFIGLVKKGEIPTGSILIIDSVDRFGRLPVTRNLRLFTGVLDAGIGLVFSGSYIQKVITNDVIDAEPGILQFVIGEMYRAHHESAEKSRKIKEALAARKAKMERGEIVDHNNVPKYFSYDPAAKRYAHNDNANVVKNIVTGFLAGKSLFGLASELNKACVKTFRKGYCWSGTSIRNILKSRTLIGEFLNSKNFLPPLIDEQQFDRVQNILSRNKNYGRGRKSKLPNIFKGVCFCASCDHVMNVATQKVKNIEYRYLVCSVQRGQSPCSNKKGMRLNEIEQEFFDSFLVKEPDSLVNDDERQEQKDLRSQRAMLETKFTTITKQIQRLAVANEGLDVPELKKQITTLDSERSKVSAAIDDINNKLRALENAPSVRADIRNILAKITLFGEGSNGEDVVKTVYAPSDSRIKEALSDPAMRDKIRLAMPSLIGKMTVDGNQGRFFVYNRARKMIYKSLAYLSNRNRSKVWQDSLKTYTTRKGKTIKRTAHPKNERVGAK